MENHSTTDTREALIKDIDNLKHDAAQIVQGVKDHATAHVDQTKKRVNDAIDCCRQQAKDHPFALLGAVFMLGYLFGRRHR